MSPEPTESTPLSGDADTRAPRAPLSRDRVLAEALALADTSGLAALSMRTLGRALGVEAMSLYNHVRNKEDLLDGLVDRVVEEIALPHPDDDWRAGMRRRAVSARAAFARHPWAMRLMESRKEPGPAAMRYYDAVLGCLRRGGFTPGEAASAFSLIDSYLYGFALQEQSLPFKTRAELGDVADAILAQLPRDTYPHLSEMIAHALNTDYSYSAEFERGLELVLDGLSALRGRRSDRAGL